jgi:SAM-dependent methyltransferase
MPCHASRIAISLKDVIHMSVLTPVAIDQSIKLPPERLRYRVAGTESAEWFTQSGRMSVQDLDRALAAINKSFAQFDDVLEWGCGCGRILRHLPTPQAPKRIYGNDIDHEAIAWVAENLPWVETSRTDGMPPLPYADNTFDLIYNHSVMTHLDAAYQDAWLAELRRVLRPGGIVTLTVSGRHAFQMFLDTWPADAPDRTFHSAELHSKGIDFIGQDQWSSDFPDFYHTTFHDVSYVFDHWASFLDVRCYIPRGALDYQDMVVLQKPMDDTVRPQSYQDYKNPRLSPVLEEQQRAIAKLLRENKLMAEELQHEQAKLRQTNTQLQQIYASRSWLLTKPWRAVGRIVKPR